MNLKKIIIKLGVPVSVFLIITGIIFKILHYNYTMPIFLFGIFGFIFTYTYKFTFISKKAYVDYAKFATVTSLVILSCVSLFHLPYKFYTTLIFFVSLGLYIVLKLKHMFFNPKPEHHGDSIDTLSADNKKTNLIIYIFYLVASILIIMGGLFKIMHWPNGKFLLISGLFAFALIFLIDSIRKF